MKYSATYQNFSFLGNTARKKATAKNFFRVNYRYDALNRITSATSDASGNYNVSGITYDKNGNIITLNRNGWQNTTTFTNMDVLSYNYGNTNQLNYVTDGGNNNYGFIDGNKSGNDYEYDANGNMIIDRNKGITNITYNHLNLPVNVTLAGGTINYTYDASGNKLRKIANSTTTEYAGNYKYVNGTLEFFNHAEGYVQKDGSSFSYVYQYKDHLGNVRLSYMDNNNDGIITPSTEIIQEKNYYPFGLRQIGYNGATSSIGNDLAQKWGYNGKEYQDDLVGGKNLNWHDFGARNYDPALGRWMNLDPLAEQMRRHSPYNYAFDNPVYFIDPDGMAPMGPGDWWRKVKQTIKNDIAAAPRQFKKMMSDLNSLFGSINVQGNHKDKIGSGVVIVGSGPTTDSNTVSENPSEDVYIPEDALTTMAKYAKLGPKSTSKGKNYGPNKAKGKKGKNFASQMKKGIKDAKARKKKMDAIGSGIDLMTSDGTINASNTAGEPKVNTVTVRAPGQGYTKTSINKVSESQSVQDSIREAKKGKFVKINRPDNEN